MAPAKTGKDKINKKTVTNNAHTNRFTSPTLLDPLFILFTVLIKLIPPKIEETPATCNLKIERSTALPGLPILLDRGG